MDVSILAPALLMSLYVQALQGADHQSKWGTCNANEENKILLKNFDVLMSCILHTSSFPTNINCFHLLLYITHKYIY